jgi:aspartate/glutamate racemase
MKTVIGILGGIGAESSARFYVDFIKKFKKQLHPKTNSDFPRIIINSIPADELISGDNQAKLQQYIIGLKFLENESDIICIICNTAYNYYDFFTTKISKPIIDLRKIVQNFLFEKRLKTVTILGTPTSYKKNLYIFKDFEYKKLTLEEETKLEKIIFKINTGSETAHDIIFIKNTFQKYKNISDAVIIGCTELATALDTINSEKKIDPMNLLINFIVEKYGK